MTRLKNTVRSIAARSSGFRQVGSMLAVAVACSAPAMVVGQSSDRVFQLPSGSVAGTVKDVSPLGVDIEGRDGEVQKIPIETIREVQFGGEPDALKAARNMLVRGRPTSALEDLKKLTQADFEGADPLVVQERDYVTAAASGRAALTGAGDPKVAGGLVAEFLSKSPKSHHTLELQELLGDLFVKAGLADKATAAYEKVAMGPPAYKVRAFSAKAKMLFDQRKFDEAARAFDAALAVDAGDEASKAQKRAAVLGKAKCLSQTGKAADAVTLVLGAIRQASPEENEMLAAAYNTLGSAHRAAGKDQDALIAFLTVDLVYNSVPEAHAEALSNLVELWKTANNPERSRKSLERLEAAYPNTPWAKQARAAIGTT